jgi:hypothetical protein
MPLGLRFTRRSCVSRVGTCVRFAIATLALLTIPMAGRARGQERPGPAAEFAVGWIGFADDGIVSEGLVGGNARWYLLPRISVGPEIVYLKGDNHTHLTVTGNLTWDLLSVNGRPSRVAPFVVVGAGLFQTRETFVSGTFTSNEGAFTAGAGVRAAVGDRITVGAETRIGWELHVRINGTLGIRVGK